jgi:hypothetical protein
MRGYALVNPNQSGNERNSAMMKRSVFLTIAAALAAIFGLALTGSAYFAWRDYNRYTIATAAVVSQRTATNAIVRVEGPIPGGHGSVELSYALLIGARSDVAPPADGPKFQVGDRVVVVHPPGEPSRARLQEGFAPAVPTWVGWLGGALVIGGAGLFLAAGKRRTITDQSCQ